MKKILFATRALAEEYAKINFAKCELRQDSADIDRFEDDESLRFLGPRSGECSAYQVLDDDENILAIVAWWEEGGDYNIKVNDETVQTVTYWSLAMHIMRGLADAEDERQWDDETYTAADITCETPYGEVINIKDI